MRTQKSELGTANLPHVANTVKPGLQQQQRSGRSGKLRKVRLKHAPVTSTCSRALPAAQKISKLIFAAGGVNDDRGAAQYCRSSSGLMRLGGRSNNRSWAARFSQGRRCTKASVPSCVPSAMRPCLSRGSAQSPTQNWVTAVWLEVVDGHVDIRQRHSRP